MSERVKPILGAVVVSVVIGYPAIAYFFGPILAQDAPAGPILPPLGALAVYSVIGALFLDWVNQQMHAPLKAALVIAVSQILIVDVYYVLNGTRGVVAALASAAVIVVVWSAVGAAYGKLLGDGGSSTATA